jgi:hypothetical protein
LQTLEIFGALEVPISYYAILKVFENLGNR